MIFLRVIEKLLTGLKMVQDVDYSHSHVTRQVGTPRHGKAEDDFFFPGHSLFFRLMKLFYCIDKKHTPLLDFSRGYTKFVGEIKNGTRHGPFSQPCHPTPKRTAAAKTRLAGQN